MATNKELEAQNKDINNRLKTLTSAYSQLTDEVHTLKRNYTRLVEDMNVRLETVAKKLFRDEWKTLSNKKNCRYNKNVFITKIRKNYATTSKYRY